MSGPDIVLLLVLGGFIVGVILGFGAGFAEGGLFIIRTMRRDRP